MAINADKPQLWKADIAASVDQFNGWFRKFAPKAYRDSRAQATKSVEQALLASKDLTDLSPATLRASPGILPALRMSACPPLARDRLIGLAGANKSLVNRMEAGELPPRMASAALEDNLARIGQVLADMLDLELFPWLLAGRKTTRAERHRAATIVADRLCGSVSDPIIRNAQEKRQLAVIGRYLGERGYTNRSHSPSRPIVDMEPGTYAFRLNLAVGDALTVNIPIDVVIQPKTPRPGRLPILIEAKSAGNFTNVNKRRKEEAAKIHQLNAKYGRQVEFLLFLCGYFDTGYLGREAAEGIDWIWEHRIGDLDQLGI
jgi:hypothetical protein